MSRSTTRPSFTASGRTVNSRRGGCPGQGRGGRGLAAAGGRAAESDPDPDHDNPDAEQAWTDVHDDGAADHDTAGADNPHDDGTTDHDPAG